MPITTARNVNLHLPRATRISAHHDRLSKSTLFITISLPSVLIDLTLKPAVPSPGVDPVKVRVERHRNTGRARVRTAISRACQHAVLYTPSRYGGDVHVVVAVLSVVSPAGDAESRVRVAGGDRLRLVVEVGAIEGEEALSRDGRGRRDGVFGAVGAVGLVGHFGGRDGRGDRVRRRDSDSGFRAVPNAAAVVARKEEVSECLVQARGPIKRDREPNKGEILPCQAKTYSYASRTAMLPPTPPATAAMMMTSTRSRARMNVTGRTPQIFL